MSTLSRMETAAAILVILAALAPPAMGRDDPPAASLTVLAAESADAVPDGLIASPEPGWPQWRGPRRDGVSEEKGLLPSWPEGGPRLLWKLTRLGIGWSSPIVVGERVYVTGDVGDDLVVFAFGVDGSLVWQVKNGLAWKGSYPGSRACAAYSEGRLYHMNAHGRVACLEADSGKELWAVDVLDRFQGKNITWAMSECLLVDGPRLIVTPGGTKGFMAALDKKSGQTVWTTDPLGQDRVTYTSPILFRHAGRRLLANCSSAHGFGVDADTGKLLWKVPMRNVHDVTVTTPVYGDGCVYYVTAYAPGGLYRLRAAGDAIQADRVWTPPLDTVTGGAVLVDGLLHTSGYRKSTWWFSLDWKTGQTRAECKDLAAGSAVWADGRLYCLAEDGTAALLRPTSGGLEVAGRLRLTPKRANDAWAHPVLSGGRLYLRYHEMLWCYDVRAR